VRAQHAAADAAERIFPPNERLSTFFAPDRTLLLIGEGRPRSSSWITSR
jgi:hypothetical protein